MKRTFVLLLVSAVAALTVVAPERSAPVTPEPPDDTSIESEQVEAARSVARCPWVRGDGFIDGSLAIGAPSAEEAAFTVASSGTVVGETTVSIEAFAVVRFLDLAAIGTGSAFVEFDAAPAAAVAVGEGTAAIATAGCRSGASKVWLLAGGSTINGETLQLRLFNPFPQDAHVEIRVVSENDAEPETALEAITVVAQSTATFDMGSLLTLRETLALSIADPDGLIVPAFVQAGEVEDEEGNETDVDNAAWTGVTPSRRWEFPFAVLDGLDTAVTIFNDRTVPVSWEIDLVGREGIDLGVLSGTLDPLTVVRVPLNEAGPAPSGIIVTSEEPLGAFLTGAGPTQRGATAGVRSATERWLVPGLSGMLGASRVWIMNSSGVAATVTYTSSVDGGLGQPEKVLVPAGSVRSFASAEDLVIDSQIPVSVGWVRSAGGSVSFTMATPVADG